MIDDEPDVIYTTRKVLEINGFMVDSYTDPTLALSNFRPGLYDLLLLDIKMPKINGFEMLELIEEPPAVIFTTAFDEYAMKAFETNAVDYLLKPYSPERFSKAVQKFLDSRKPGTDNQKVGSLLETAAKSPQQTQRIVVKTGGNIKIIPTSDIIFLEAADDYVKIHTKDGSYLKNKTMSYFEQILPPAQFTRTHRSYIVNLQQITRIDPYEKDSQIATLKSGQRIPVSKNGYAKLKELLGI